jgi:uncharacterized protein YecT (DUF1311 family)
MSPQDERGLIEQFEALNGAKENTTARLAEFEQQKKEIAEAHRQMMKAIQDGKKDTKALFHDQRKALLKDVERKIWQLVNVFVGLVRMRV